MTLKSIYFAYFHSIIKYGIIYWCNSCSSAKIFTLHKIIRILSGAQPKTSYRSLFKKLEILQIRCQYLLSLLNFIVNKQEIFQRNSSVDCINARNKHHLHRPNSNLSCFKKRCTLCCNQIFQHFAT